MCTVDTWQFQGSTLRLEWNLLWSFYCQLSVYWMVISKQVAYEWNDIRLKIFSYYYNWIFSQFLLQSFIAIGWIWSMDREHGNLVGRGKRFMTYDSWFEHMGQSARSIMPWEPVHRPFWFSLKLEVLKVQWIHLVG